MSAPAPSAPARLPVTAVIAAKDEAGQIADCVASVAWAAEVLVVENDSTDDTVERARHAGAVVFSHPFTTIGGQRNAAIARAAHDWVLVLDADERAAPAMSDEIDAVLAGGPRFDAYHVPRRNFFLGTEIRHGGWQKDRPVRFFRRELRYDASRVHERVVTRGTVGALRQALEHYTYRSLDQYFEKLGRYSAWWAADRARRGQRMNAFDIITRPPARFVAMYVLRGGWRDGRAGVVVATLAAVSVAARYAKLWELTRSGAALSAER